MGSWTVSILVAIATVVLVVSGTSWVPDATHKCYSGCPSGFFRHNSSCYVVPRVLVTWGQAVVYCRALNSELLTIETEDEQTFLQKEMLKHHDLNQVFWLAASDMLVEGSWRWVRTMSPVLLTFWKPGQPDNQKAVDGIHAQHCAQLNENGWDDDNCKKKLNFICERPIL
ncbi:hypothetical protein SNE40_009482 [Patella caerulea]|uniref:C-type lectin domain-containing protein n=1 Tax=Patella caerulea TaxID=87958 RepID=A0AAN8JZ49_PATCE